MKLTWVLQILGICLLASAVQAEQKLHTISLGTNVVVSEAPSVSLVKSGSIEHIECILEKMQYPYEIRPLPWRRARQDVRAGALDGFFTAAAVDSANNFAKFSSPLVLESWYWFWRVDVTQPESWKNDYLVGTILGSQQESILTAEGYTKTVPANSLEQLVKLLMSKRVDVILVDRKQFEKQAELLGIRDGQYQSRFFRYMPLGVYFSNRFLQQYPNFLNAFNHQILGCSDSGYKLSSSESARIKMILKPLVDQIAKSSEIEKALDHIRNLTSRSKADLEQIDNDWREASKKGETSFMDRYLLTKANKYLHEILARNNSVLSEVIVVNNKGYNVAVEPMTSDFWQGDESKFLKAIILKPGEFFEDLIVYDASSHKFAVQFSTPFFNDEGHLMGVITLGVDVDKALSKIF